MDTCASELALACRRRRRRPADVQRVDGQTGGLSDRQAGSCKLADMRPCGHVAMATVFCTIRDAHDPHDRRDGHDPHARAARSARCTISHGCMCVPRRAPGPSARPRRASPCLASPRQPATWPGRKSIRQRQPPPASPTPGHEAMQLADPAIRDCRPRGCTRPQVGPRTLVRSCPLGPRDPRTCAARRPMPGRAALWAPVSPRLEPHAPMPSPHTPY